MGRVRSVYRALEHVEVPAGYDLDLGHLEELVQHTSDWMSVMRGEKVLDLLNHKKYYISVVQKER